jgi:hypothetical protein
MVNKNFNAKTLAMNKLKSPSVIIYLMYLLLAPKQGQAQNQGAIDYINNLQAIHTTFKTLADTVSKRSDKLSDIERRKAAEFLSGTFDLVMESYVYKGDPAKPDLTVWMTDYRKFAGDNPHTIYTQFPVHKNYTYKLSGRLGNAFYFGIQAYTYKSGFNLTSANLSLPSMEFEDDGTFEVYFSETRPSYAKNWIKLTEGDHAVLLRQYFQGKKNIQAGQFRIVRVDSSRAQVITYEERLKKAEQMITEYIKGTLEVCDLLKSNAFNNYAKPGAEVRMPKYGGALYPTKDNTYDGFWVSLKKGEAVHLHGRLPEKTIYASYVFYDRWYMTPDYKSIRSYLTNSEVTLNADGTYDIYISPEKVNHPNWIDTGGLYEGSYSSRYLLSGSKEFPTVQIVQIKNIK